MMKATSLLFAVSMSFLFACDTGEDPIAEERAALADEDPADDARAERDHHGKRGDHAERASKKLCNLLECSDEQAAQIRELIASRHEDRDRNPDARAAHKAARAEANEAIAAAFAAEDFDPSVLERVKPERGGDHQDEMIAFATELHGILTPEQRALLADKIEVGGPMFFAGHRGKKSHHGKQRRHAEKGEGPDRTEHDPSQRLAHHVERFCEPVACTEDQRTQLSATFEGVHEARREARAQQPKPDFGSIAELFRAETLDAGALRSAVAASKAEHMSRKAEHGKEFAAVVAELHDILTPEQRAMLAKEIEEHGVHALVGRRGKHGKHGDKRGRRGGRHEG